MYNDVVVRSTKRGIRSFNTRVVTETCKGMVETCTLLLENNFTSIVQGWTLAYCRYTEDIFGDDVPGREDGAEIVIFPPDSSNTWSTVKGYTALGAINDRVSDPRRLRLIRV